MQGSSNLMILWSWRYNPTDVCSNPMDDNLLLPLQLQECLILDAGCCTELMLALQCN